MATVKNYNEFKNVKQKQISIIKSLRDIRESTNPLRLSDMRRAASRTKTRSKSPEKVPNADIRYFDFLKRKIIANRIRELREVLSSQNSSRASKESPEKILYLKEQINNLSNNGEKSTNFLEMFKNTIKLPEINKLEKIKVEHRTVSRQMQKLNDLIAESFILESRSPSIVSFRDLVLDRTDSIRPEIPKLILSLDDVCSKPISLRFSSNLSREGKIAMIKSYEDALRQELIRATPVKSISGFLKNEQQPKLRKLEKLKAERKDADEEKLKYSHCIESAMTILDYVKQLKTTKRPQEINEEFELSESDRNLVRLYGQWVNLWNKEFS
jgi:hypothetical protein